MIGRSWGKRTLIARVSPNKTWEGLWGGIFSALAIAIVVTFIVFRRSYVQSMLVDFLALVVSVFAIVGDLFESMLKRQVGVKDSGYLLPGHGGILDRIDSTLSALPIFLLGLLFLFK
ncbi:phosphatidate cytidylyltransferase [Coxiella endosymbiont of Amblyomma sculptum]|uniref:phosphatidate cytidylyltransferase n=1 Tax=Coxiella endosymbiont of Amblyomma sculptum TaxID=2487929 RepID=UPI001FE74CE8|nr:CDP-archaeol synthase [Coxiella endosymbiont of Amblyomma sculptum]